MQRVGHTIDCDMQGALQQNQVMLQSGARRPVIDDPRTGTKRAFHRLPDKRTRRRRDDPARKPGSGILPHRLIGTWNEWRKIVFHKMHEARKCYAIRLTKPAQNGGSGADLRVFESRKGRAAHSATAGKIFERPATLLTKCAKALGNTPINVERGV